MQIPCVYIPGPAPAVSVANSLVYTCRRFPNSVPLKRMASSKNIFVWFCGVLICQRGQIPRRTRPCGVSEPAEQDPVGYQTPQNKTLRGIRPRRSKSCGVSDPAEQWQICVHFIAYTCSAGSDTPQNNVLRGMIPHRTMSYGV